MVRTYALPESFESILRLSLSDLNIQIEDSARIAECVLKMSDFYIAQPQAATPWKEKWCQIAQLAYFLPLNFLRAQSVFLEAQARKFPLGSNELLDFGSGLGAGSLPWLSQFDGPFAFVESSAEAQKIHQRILALIKPQQKTHWLSEREIRSQKNRTALFSYSLTELAKIPAWVENCESLIIIEPSTRDDGRKLLQFRKDLLAKGFSMWAPCPHQMDCPLFSDSKTDWCHDRIGFEMPLWFQKIENHLPIKNRSLTFCYLLASKSKAPATQQWRTVGDQLDEKGKTRQLLCRDSHRQFLAWMHREGPAPEIPRGVLIDPPENYEVKSNEIRIHRKNS